MGLINGSKREYKRFERAFKRIWKGKAVKRQADQRNAFLTPDLINVHRKTRKNLVLEYGRHGLTITYTPQQLDKFARQIDKTEDKFEDSKGGVPVPQLLRTSLADDIRRAKQQIRTSVLYKIERNTLFFRATASGKTKYSFYQIRVRLDDWFRMIRKHGTGASYYMAARMTAQGRVSFDCSCGRHQYWFRYLATIGGFALDPYEHAFPKIRNPKLRGCCCKHVIKTLAVLQQSAALLRIEKEMQRQAKKKGWFTKLLGKKTPGARYTDKDTLRAMEAPGVPSAADIEDAFRKFNMAKLGIRKKMSEPSMRKRLEEAVVKEKTFQGIAKQERRRAEGAERRADQAVKDKIVAELETRLVKAKYVDKIPKKEAIKQYADKMGMTVEAITFVAKEANLL